MMYNYLCEGIVQSYPDLLKRPHLQTQSGRSSTSKVITFLCKHEDTAVMDIVRAMLADNGKTVLANIHGAIVVKQRLSAALKQDIKFEMQ